MQEAQVSVAVVVVEQVHTTTDKPVVQALSSFLTD
jgi:hypothetical protein